MLGITDRPVESIKDDLLGVDKHISGLSDFIKICDTPMTIAIQGDWGTGKTSFMNMVRELTCDDVVPVWFNTWQFFQFHLADILSYTLLSTLLTSLNSTYTAVPQKPYETLNTLIQVALTVDRLS